MKTRKTIIFVGVAAVVAASVVFLAYGQWDRNKPAPPPDPLLTAFLAEWDAHPVPGIVVERKMEQEKGKMVRATMTAPSQSMPPIGIALVYRTDPVSSVASFYASRGDGKTILSGDYRSDTWPSAKRGDGWARDEEYEKIGQAFAVWVAACKKQGLLK